MPIVKEGTAAYDQLIKPLRINDMLPEELPDITGMLEADAVAAGDIYEDSFPGQSSALSNVSTQFGMASVAMGAGTPASGGMWAATTPLLSIPSADLITEFNRILGNLEKSGASQSMTSVFNAMELTDFPQGIGSMLVESLLDLIGPTLEIVSGIVEAATSWIPILGGFIRGIVTLIKVFGREKSTWQEYQTPPMSFHPGMDVVFAENYLLRPMRGQWVGEGPNRSKGGHDLMNIFRPTGTSVSSHGTLVQGTRDTGREVRRLTGIGAAGLDGNWAGMMPGSTMLDRGWEISEDGCDRTGTRPLGGLKPTGSDIGSKLWGMITKAGSPLMYTLRPETLKMAWSHYLWSLRTMIVGDESDPNWGFFSGAAKAEFINNIAGPVYGWSHYPAGEGGVGGNMAKVVPYGNGTKIIDREKSFGLENSIPMRALDNLAELQRGAMDNTAVCAYVDETYPGIPDKDRWHDNRMSLLQHPLRCQVDVSSIPDTAYRNAMISAKQSCGLYLSAGPIKLRPNAPQTASVVQGLSSIGSSSGTPLGDELTGEGDSGRGGLVIAAAVLGLIVLSQKKR